MSRTLLIVRYVAVVTIMLALAGLGWWYTFLRTKQDSIQEADAGRGIGVSAPTFQNSVGSTYSNVASTLGNDEGGATVTASGRLIEISKNPVAGFGFIVASSTTLRFVERSTGNVIDYHVETQGLVRVSNMLVPKVYEALVSHDGKLIERTLRDTGEIVTFSATVGGTTASSTLSVHPLPDGIHSITFDAMGKEIAYVISSATGTSFVRALWDGTKATQLFSSGTAGWQISWPGRFVATQDPSDSLVGYSYEIRSGALVPLAKAQGLTLRARASSTAIVYGASGNSLSLFGQLDSSASPVTLPVRTIADKCVWSPGVQRIVFCAVPQRSPGANFLDRWHRGETHSEDAWWRVDLGANSAELFFAPGTPLDVENPMLDDEAKYVAFMNAIDKSLWLLRIAQ